MFQLVGVSFIFVSSAQALENLTQHLCAATSGGSFGPPTFVAGQDRQRDVKMGVCVVMDPKLVACGYYNDASCNIGGYGIFPGMMMMNCHTRFWKFHHLGH